ncbi:hypothetical protein QQ045_001381 [Rhodiola kirilowii]
MVGGVTVRSHKLRPVTTKPADQCVESEAVEASWTTPTGKEARIDDRLLCPPAPRKRRSDKWNYGGAGGGVVREYFTVPDLESVFVMRRQIESANLCGLESVKHKPCGVFDSSTFSKPFLKHRGEGEAILNTSSKGREAHSARGGKHLLKGEESTFCERSSSPNIDDQKKNVFTVRAKSRLPYSSRF